MGIRRRWNALRPGLAVGTDAHNEDFWGIVFGRPSAALLLSLIADLPFVTPDRLTHLSNVLIAAGSLVLLVPRDWAFPVAAVLLNLSLTVDCADGQLARYRGRGSEVGSYYDKVSDTFGFTLMFACLGWVCHERTGDPLPFVLALVTLAGMLIMGYAKWLQTSILYRMGHPPAPRLAPPPRSRMRLALDLARRLLDFNEPDVFLWIGLALLMDHPEWSLYLLAPTQVYFAVLYSVRRGRAIAEAETGRTTDPAPRPPVRAGPPGPPPRPLA